MRVEILGTITPVILESRGPTVTECDLAGFEERLGYRLPEDYREFLLKYNGGSPAVGDVVGRDDGPGTPYQYGAISTFFMLPGPGAEIPPFCDLRSPAEIADQVGWNLPRDILPIADNPGGHCFVLELGQRKGLVRYLDDEVEIDPITRHLIVADNFLDLLRVVSVEEKAAITKLQSEAERKALVAGPFPAKLEAQCRMVEDAHPDIRSWIRALCVGIFNQKGYFAVHADDASRVVLDLAFWLYQTWRGDDAWIQRTELDTMSRCWWHEDEKGFGLDGHALGFLEDWWDDRVATGALEGSTDRARFTKAAAAELVRNLILQHDDRRTSGPNG